MCLLNNTTLLPRSSLVISSGRLSWFFCSGVSQYQNQPNSQPSLVTGSSAEENTHTRFRIPFLTTIGLELTFLVVVIWDPLSYLRPSAFLVKVPPFKWVTAQPFLTLIFCLQLEKVLWIAQDNLTILRLPTSIL